LKSISQEPKTKSQEPNSTNQKIRTEKPTLKTQEPGQYTKGNRQTLRNQQSTAIPNVRPLNFHFFEFIICDLFGSCYLIFGILIIL
jgi:hypothetical protein